MKNRKVKSKIFHFNFLEKNRRGEMTSQQIVILIILIASFAILLFFLFRLNLGSETEMEVCHNSVVARGSAVIPTEAVPLDCKRGYICITQDGSCEDMTKPIKKKVKTKEEIYDVLANEMADCWWTFGESELNYVGEDLKPKMYCSICSQIAFDDSVKKIVSSGELDKKEFYQYLALKNMSGSDITYAKYLLIGDTYDAFEGDFGIIDLDKQYYSLIGMTSDVSTLGYVGLGAGIAAGLLLTPITGGTSLVSVVGFLSVATAGTAGYFVAPIIQGKIGNNFIPPSLIEVNSKEFDSLECKEIATIS
jgi:hypothetical protein